MDDEGLLGAPETKACPRCAEDVKGAALVCRFCGYQFAPRRLAALGAEHLPAEGRSPDSVIDARKPPRKPWYYSNAVLIVTFLLLFPVWAILILTNGGQRTIVRVLAGIVGAVSVLLFGSAFLGAPLLSSVSGPGVIEFGSDYRQTNSDFTVVGPRATFTMSDQVAWVARFKGAANTTKLDVALSRVQGSGETVLSRESMSIADPRYSVVASKFPVALLVRGEFGTYRLRVYSGDTVLALGEFMLAVGGAAPSIPATTLATVAPAANAPTMFGPVGPAIDSCSKAPSVTAPGNWQVSAVLTGQRAVRLGLRDKNQGNRDVVVNARVMGPDGTDWWYESSSDFSRGDWHDLTYPGTVHAPVQRAGTYIVLWSVQGRSAACEKFVFL